LPFAIFATDAQDDRFGAHKRYQHIPVPHSVCCRLLQTDLLWRFHPRSHHETLRIQVKPVAARDRRATVFPDAIQSVSATVAPLQRPEEKPGGVQDADSEQRRGAIIPLSKERFEVLCLKRQGLLQT
jgi:hypothetical protein